MLPAGQPRQEKELLRARSSLGKDEKKEGRRGGRQLRGAHSERVEAELEEGCRPMGQE